MKRTQIIALLFVMGAPVVALADTYALTTGWTDPTPTGPNYTPTYGIEYQVAASPVVPIGNLTAPAWSGSITANPADVVRVRAQNRNTQGPLNSAWSSWVTATAASGPTQPSDPASVSISLMWTGRP